MMHTNNDNSTYKTLAAGAPIERQHALALTEGQATAYFVSGARIGIVAAHALLEPAAVSAFAN
jgi:hypothetical protein